MSAFPIHTIESAPEQSRPSLEALQAAFGVIPNIAGAMATSPVLIGSLVGLFGKVHGGSFSEEQIQIVLLTNAVTNACSWAVAFHSFLAVKEGVDAADVDAIREGRIPRVAKSAALSALARTLIEKRGQLDNLDQTAFLDTGFDKEHLLEVVAIVAASTITNYSGNVTQPPLEDAFQAYRWNAKRAQ
jgi:alkylhydroperoxidase family enzyme